MPLTTTSSSHPYNTRNRKLSLNTEVSSGSSSNRTSSRTLSVDLGNIGSPKSSPLSSPRPISGIFINATPEIPFFTFPTKMDKYSKIERISKLIPEFDGNPDELIKFISCVDRVSDQCKEADEKTLLVDHILFRLGSNVYNLIANVKPNTWEEIKSQLSRFYQVEDNFDDVERKISSLKFEPLYESIQDYYLRAENLVNRYKSLLQIQNGINDNAKTQSISEKRVVPRFIMGLPEQIRNYVRIHKNESLRSCMEAAVQELNFEKNLYGSKSDNIDITHKSLSTSSVNQQNSQQDVQQSFQRNSREYPKICNYCKNRGHILAECRLRMRNNSQPMNRSYMQSSQFRNGQQSNRQYSTPPNYQNQNRTYTGNNSTQNRSYSSNNGNQNRSIQWRDPVITSSPIKNPQNQQITRYHPSVDNITDSLRGLEISRHPDYPNSRVNYYYADDSLPSENSDGLSNGQERNDA